MSDGLQTFVRLQPVGYFKCRWPLRRKIQSLGTIQKCCSGVLSLLGSQGKSPDKAIVVFTEALSMAVLNARQVLRSDSDEFRKLLCRHGGALAQKFDFVAAKQPRQARDLVDQ